MKQLLAKEYRDMKGRLIGEGFILKVFHFIGARNKKYYMYKIAAVKNGHLVAMCIKELLTKGKDHAHTCRMEALPLEDTEIVCDY